jgi:hypothetical protein
VTGWCEKCSGHSVYIKSVDLINKLINYQLPKQNSAPWSQSVAQRFTNSVCYSDHRKGTIRSRADIFMCGLTGIGR